MPSERTEHGAFIAVHSIVNVQYTNSDFNMFIYVLYFDIKLSHLRSFVRLFVRSMDPDSNASLPNSNVATWQRGNQHANEFPRMKPRCIVPFVRGALLCSLTFVTSWLLGLLSDHSAYYVGQ